MLVLHGPALTASITDPAIRSLVEQRWNEILDGEDYDYDRHGYFIVVEPGDRVEDLEKEGSCPIIHDLFAESRYGDDDFTPAFEVVEDHPECYEMVFVFSDDGFGLNLYIAKYQHGINAELLGMCAEYAVPASASVP